jgi:hypothetical protein
VQREFEALRQVPSADTDRSVGDPDPVVQDVRFQLSLLDGCPGAVQFAARANEYRDLLRIDAIVAALFEPARHALDLVVHRRQMSTTGSAPSRTDTVPRRSSTLPPTSSISGSSRRSGSRPNLV